MSLFGFKMENAEGRNPGEDGEVEAGGLDESETATAAITEVQQEDAEVAEAEAEAEDLDGRVELAEELHDSVEPVVTEGLGLDRAGMALLLAGMKRVAGKNYKHLVGKDVKMEAIDAGLSGRREQTSIQFESLKDTLKSAWEAIKAAFRKAWAKIKTTYIKTFDASKKLKARAVKVRDRAEGSSGTIDKKTFSFSGAKTLAVGGKKLEGGDLKSALGALEKIIDDNLDTVKSDSVGGVAEELADTLGDVDDSKFDTAINTLYGKVIEKCKIKGLGGDVSDPKVKASLGESSEVTLAASAELPGGKLIVNVTGKGGSSDTAERIAGIRRTRTTMVNAKDKPKEVSSEASTLSNSQVAGLCDEVIKIADNIFDFKKGWENRDRDQEKTIKAIDASFKDFTNDKDQGDKAKRSARAIAAAATGILRRDSSFKSALISYSLNVCNVTLSYCEGSLSQHKK